MLLEALSRRWGDPEREKMPIEFQPFTSCEGPHVRVSHSVEVGTCESTDAAVSTVPGVAYRRCQHAIARRTSKYPEANFNCVQTAGHTRNVQNASIRRQSLFEGLH